MSDSTRITRLADRITIEERGPILLIGLDRPNKLNAFDPDMFVGLATALTKLDEDTDLRCGVVFAHGTDFTVGIDLTAIAPLFASGKAVWPKELVDPWCLPGNRQRKKPLVLAIHGRCFTLGLELALAGDICIAAKNTRFAQMEVTRGIMPFGGATMRLPRSIGWNNAMRYLLTGDEFDSNEAKRLGIVQETVPTANDCLDRAIALATHIADQAPLAVQATLSSARQAQLEGFAKAAQTLSPASLALLNSEDAKEGVQSFIERRKPEFTGR